MDKDLPQFQMFDLDNLPEQKYDPENFPQKSTIQGITNQKSLVTESILIASKISDLHKVYVYNLDIDFDRILGLDFLEQYECTIDLK